MERPSEVPSASVGAEVAETKSQIDLRLTNQFRNRLRKFTVIVFLLLIFCSFTCFLTTLILWYHWPRLDGLTNMYPAFFGFASATVINIVGSLAGISTFTEGGGQRMDTMHSTAVCMLLTAALIYNVIFPTSGLMPLEIDSKKRIIEIPIMDCSDLRRDLKGIPLPECEHAEGAEIWLYLMYPLIVLELVALVSYGYLKRQQYKTTSSERDNLTLNSIFKDADSMTGQSLVVDAMSTFVTPRDVAIILPQAATGKSGAGTDVGSGPGVKKRISDHEQSYWPPGAHGRLERPGPVLKSQSVPLQSKGP